jgi:hypothetical protein
VTKVNSCNNNNNNNIILNAKKILVASIALVFLLSSTIFIQNQTILLSLLSQQQQQSSSSSSFLSSPIPSLAYADKIKMKNKSLINDISDQLVKDNGNNSKDELQNILQQIQMQISLIAGQDKATNAIKQIESVIEPNPNGPLAQSLLFLAKQQATGNIGDVNKVTTDIARYAAAGGDSVVGLLEQSVAAATPPPPSSSSSIIPSSPQQQPSQPPSSSSTIASFGNNSSSDNDNSNGSFTSTSPQITPQSIPLSQTTGTALSEIPPYNLSRQDREQILQSQPTEWQQQQQKQQEQEQAKLSVLSGPEQQQQIQPQSDIDPSTSSSSNLSPILSSSSIPPLINSQNQSPGQPQSLPSASLALPPSQASLYPNNNNNENNNAYDYNNTSNPNNADNIASNSTPQSTIKVTSSDQPTEPIYPNLPLSMSNSTKQQNQSDGREQLQQRIQEIMNEFNSVNRNDRASLPKYIERN